MLTMSERENGASDKEGCLEKAAGGCFSAIVVTACLAGAAICSSDRSSFLTSKQELGVFGLDLNNESDLPFDFGPDGKAEWKFDLSLSQGQNPLLGLDILVSSDSDAKALKDKGVLAIIIKPSK